MPNLKPLLHDTTCCQSGCQTGCGLTTSCIVYIYSIGCQTRLSNHLSNRLYNRLYNRFDNRLYRVNKHPTGCGLTTGWMFVYTIQPAVNRLYNGFDNRLYRVNGLSQCQGTVWSWGVSKNWSHKKNRHRASTSTSWHFTFSAMLS